MAPHPDDREPSSADDSSRLAPFVERFEEAWQGGEAPNLDAYLPADPAVRRAALACLVHVDMERRLKAGEAVRVEDYLRRYPELADDGALRSLVEAEYRLRRRQEPALAREE